MELLAGNRDKQKQKIKITYFKQPAAWVLFIFPIFDDEIFADNLLAKFLDKRKLHVGSWKELTLKVSFSYSRWALTENNNSMQAADRIRTLRYFTSITTSFCWSAVFRCRWNVKVVFPFSSLKWVNTQSCCGSRGGCTNPIVK